MLERRNFACSYVRRVSLVITGMSLPAPSNSLSNGSQEQHLEKGSKFLR
jgi:hypothetical protein